MIMIIPLVIVFLSSTIVSIDAQRRTSSITITSTYTTTSVITISRKFTCASLVGVTGPCGFGRRRRQVEIEKPSILIFKDQLNEHTDQVQDVPYPNIVPTKTTAVEMTFSTQLLNDANIQQEKPVDGLYQSLSISNAVPINIESSMVESRVHHSGWSKIGSAILWKNDEDKPSPRIFWVQILSVASANFCRRRPPITVTITTTTTTETSSFTTTTSGYMVFFIQLCTPSPFPALICP